MQFWSPKQLEDELLEHQENAPLGEGATLERRQVLQLSGMAVLWLMLPASVRAAEQEKARGPARESIQRIMAEVHEAATRLMGQASPDEEAYVRLMSQLMRRMPSEPSKPFYGWRPGESGYAMDTSYFSAPVVLLQIKVEPGGVIRLHDHRHYNGVLMGLTGEVEVSNYNVAREVNGQVELGKISEAAGEKEFFIRQKSKAVLRPGDLSTLTRDRDNIHEVRGGKTGGILLDLFTYFSPEARSYELEVIEEVARHGLRRVAWKA